MNILKPLASKPVSWNLSGGAKCQQKHLVSIISPQRSCRLGTPSSPPPTTAPRELGAVAKHLCLVKEWVAPVAREHPAPRLNSPGSWGERDMDDALGGSWSLNPNQPSAVQLQMAMCSEGTGPLTQIDDQEERGRLLSSILGAQMCSPGESLTWKGPPRTPSVVTGTAVLGAGGEGRSNSTLPVLKNCSTSNKTLERRSK